MVLTAISTLTDTVQDPHTAVSMKCGVNAWCNCSEDWKQMQVLNKDDSKRSGNCVSRQKKAPSYTGHAWAWGPSWLQGLAGTAAHLRSLPRCLHAERGRSLPAAPAPLPTAYTRHRSHFQANEYCINYYRGFAAKS